MTQEDKQLLLKDLCARLLYGVCVHIRYKTGEPCYGKLTPRDIQWFIDSKIENMKPYLRPITSMTEEEDKEWQLYKNNIACSCDENLNERINELHDWFNKKGFDYRGLIPRGLALEAPEGVYNN